MSLGIIIKGTEGIVLAAESRVTLSSQQKLPDGKETTIHVNFDNATKLLSFNGKNSHIGGVTYGNAAIGYRTAHSFISEFETGLSSEDELTVEAFAKQLSDFFLKQWDEAGMPKAEAYNGQNMTFLIAGYDKGEPYGRIYKFDIPKSPKVVEQNAGKNNFGISWGGQREIVDRLLMGYDPRLLDVLVKTNLMKGSDVQKAREALKQLQLALPIQFMPLQDCINLAILFIRTTISTQSLTVGLRGCGGDIDVAIITRNHALSFIQKKEIIAEN